jgi:hypothetical protein
MVFVSGNLQQKVGIFYEVNDPQPFFLEAVILRRGLNNNKKFYFRRGQKIDSSLLQVLHNSKFFILK